MNEEIQKAYKQLRNYAFYLNKNYEDAEDLLQDTVLRMLEKIDSFATQSGKSLIRWGSSIMHNLYVDRMRVKKNFLPEDVLLKIADTVIEKDERIRELQLKLKNKNYLEVFILRKFGLSYEEISNYLEVPINTTNSRMHLMKRSLCER